VDIIKLRQQEILDVLGAAGIAKAEVVLYEVPEKACIENAGLGEAQLGEFDWQAVWAAVEISSERVDLFWDSLGQAARYADRFPEFVRAVRYAVVNEDDYSEHPGAVTVRNTMIAFRGFQWEPDEETAAMEAEAAEMGGRPAGSQPAE